MTIEKSDMNRDFQFPAGETTLAAPKKSTPKARSTRLGMAYFVFFAFAVALHASSIGVAVNGTCEAGSCPATPIPFNSTVTLPFDFTFALADGDMYLINGSFTGIDNSDGDDDSNIYDFQVTYEGNASGGPSAADTITVQRDAAFQSSISSADFDTTLVGAFSPGIAAASSASTCFGGTLACLGPVTPPGSFDQTSGSFSISNTSGAFVDDKTFTNNFGAGSPVGSYIVWGQTTALPPPSAPEPASLGLIVLGLGMIFIARRARRPRGVNAVAPAPGGCGLAEPLAQRS